MLYNIERVTIEVISAIACFVLIKFMINPFKKTGETRYLGLPLGFGFLGVSYAFSAFSYSPYFNFMKLGWIQLFVRAFAFFFLAITYYFSKSEENPKKIFNILLSVLFIVFIVLVILITVISPTISFADYIFWSIAARVFSMICLGYITFRIIKSQRGQLDPAALAVPIGFILLIVEQYSAINWIVDTSYFALFGGIAFRLASLSIFLFVTFKSYYGTSSRRDRMKVLRRDRLKIYGDILSAFYLEAGSNKIVMTKIQVKVKLPYDRLVLFTKELVQLGFVEDYTSLKLTEKGKQYLKEYERTLIFLNHMGLSYRK